MFKTPSCWPQLTGIGGGAFPLPEPKLGRRTCRVFNTLLTSVLSTDSVDPQQRDVDLSCYDHADTLQARFGARHGFRCIG